MKSFTRIVLPILLVVGVVSGITIIQMNSGEDPVTEQNTPGGPRKNSTMGQPLRFFTTTAAPPKGPVKDVDENKRHLIYWNDQLEVGAPGHYEFWCENRNEQPVTARVASVNCQCASVDYAVVPPDAQREYLVESALTGGPLGSGPAAVLAHLNFRQKLEWRPLYVVDTGEKVEQTVPAATAAGPQLAIVRLNWKGKGEVGTKTIGARVFAAIADGPSMGEELQANISVIPAFEVVARAGDGAWSTKRIFSVGSLRENGVVKITAYLASGTRQYLNYSVAPEEEHPCISFSDPVPATEEEIRSLVSFLSSPSGEAPPSLRQVQSLYKTEITVRERVETDEGGKKAIKQLDLGTLDRKITAKAFDGGTWTLLLQGRVLGDITIVSGAETGHVELGNSLPANQTHTRDLLLLAERTGLDLTLDKNDIVPDYLRESRLEPLPATPDGRKQWRLRVLLPKNSLFGVLPPTSVIILKTTGPTQRQFRIPVHGGTFQPGGPGL
jgi:hypothetical protein